LKLPNLFLENLARDNKEFLNLLDLTAKVHGENRQPVGKTDQAFWNEDFFHLRDSSIWKSLTDEKKKQVLVKLSQKILQEAYFIECAGMAYAGKMNLAAKSKEERAFFCFVGEEEAKHLRLIESLTNFNTTLSDIPSFALLIGEIIQEASKPSHLLMIQILLEGWGLHYYKSLAKASMDEDVANAFKSILKDEIRHHSAGVLLFSSHKTHLGLTSVEVAEFMDYLERVAFMVKIGPYGSCEEIFKQLEGHGTPEQLETLLTETEAVRKTSDKLEILEQLLCKSLPDEVMKSIREKGILKPLNLKEMTQVLAQSIL